jgi:hypothetical protein
MKFRWAVMSLFAASCGSSDSGRDSDTAATGTMSTGTVDPSGTSTGMTGATTTVPTTGSSMTEGMGSATSTGTGAATTQNSGDSDASTSGDTSGPGTSGSTGTTGPIVETTGTSTGEAGSTSTGEPCIPTPEVCNDLDDDCNDIVDDVDVGGDGICDCLNIALFGIKGGNPAAEFEIWLEAQGTKVDRIQIDNTPLTQQIVDAYDIIILDRLVRNYTADEAKLLQGWVSDAGGGLMSMTGYTGGAADVDRPNSIIGPMGLSYNNSQGIINGPVVQWNMHPVSQDITSVTFLGGFYIDIKDDGFAKNTVVATLPQGPVAVAQTRAAGKLLIWGDEWIEYDSEWKNIPQIKQLWVNILGWLSPAGYCSIPQ